MRKIFILTSLTAALFLKAAAQEIPIENGWQFARGDSSQWASPAYNDLKWQHIEVNKPWEEQGYPNYDGFGWYRLHFMLPSSIKEKAFLKDSIRINLGIVDDNDEVYLNGKLIGEYGKNHISCRFPHVRISFRVGYFKIQLAFINIIAAGA